MSEQKSQSINKQSESQKAINDKNIVTDPQQKLPEQKQYQKDEQNKEGDQYGNLNQNIEKLTKNLERRLIRRKQRKIKQRDDMNDLFDSIEQSSNMVFSKLQDLNRKPTIIISISKILPEIPENFPKNYNVQITYEDVVLTGNQKFTDFDQNNIDDKLILPLLSTQSARFEIWTAEQEPSVYDKAVFNLEKDIQRALTNPNYENQINLQNNPEASISYALQLQGIGFSAWLKNIQSLKEAEQERNISRKEAKTRTQRNKIKVQEKKMKFKQKFNDYDLKTTKQYNAKGVDDILKNLEDD